MKTITCIMLLLLGIGVASKSLALGSIRNNTTTTFTLKVNYFDGSSNPQVCSLTIASGQFIGNLSFAITTACGGTFSGFYSFEAIAPFPCVQSVVLTSGSTTSVSSPCGFTFGDNGSDDLNLL